MKIFYRLLIFTLTAAALPLGAAQQARAPHRKSGLMGQMNPQIRDLRSAGPVWKNAAAPRTAQKYWGTMERSLRADQAVYELAASRGLEVHGLELAANGTPLFISGKLGRPATLTAHTAPALTMPSAVQSAAALADLQLAQQWLETFAPVLKLRQPAAELSLSRYETDDLGSRHLRLQQSFQNVPVWAHELYLHLDATGQVYAVNGRYAPTPAQVDVTAAGIDGDQAIARSRAHLAAQNRLRDIPAGLQPLLRFSEPRSQKAIWVDKAGVPHLVWQIDIYANVRDWFTIMVDARSGDVLQQYSNTMSEGSSNANGTDLGGTSRAFRAYEQNGTYYMLSDVNELSGNASNLPDNPTGGLWVIDLRNTDPSENSQFYHVTSSSASSWSDRSAVSAMHNLKVTYDYYKNTHGRRAIDDKASTIVTVVNVTEDGQAMENAYWNGSAIFWGNGGDYFTPLAGALDVAAHELTHGVTEYTANLIYQDQSGALNESFSDIFGAMVDREDWLMGEDIMRPGKGGGLRDIANPHSTAVLDQLPQTLDEYDYTTEDNGGVHTNCGIPSYAAYLIATNIGKEKMEKIYYRALSYYLTRQSQFIDARKAVEQSTIDLHGSGTELTAVKAAFDAVKIGSSGGGGTTPSGAGDNEVAATTGGKHWIAFVRDDLQIGLYDITNDTDLYFPNIRINSKEYNFGQFSITADGHYLYFVNDSGQLSRIDVSGVPGNYYYETFSQYYISSAGDLWNCSVSRDGQYIALTSTYENDNNIYLLINGSIYYIPLEIPSTQEGITGMTIQYPDVLNWSPNAKYPKLAFDAFNQIDLATGVTRDWWSMGEIDFTGEQYRLYSLLPAQPEGISVGNVQYSSTDPDRVAYNLINDADNTWDINIVNFAATGQDLYLQFPDRNVQRPSFSPDDRYIVVDRYTDSKLLILELSSLNFTVLNTSTGARYPEWFVVGGSYDLEVDARPAGVPLDYTLAANWPNPFNAGTMISFTLPKPGRIYLAIYDLQGRLVTTLAEGVREAGRHSLTWQGTGADGKPAASGIYYCRLEAEGGVTASRKLTLLK